MVRFATTAALAIFVSTGPESAAAQLASHRENKKQAAEAIVETANAEASDPAALEEAKKRKLQDEAGSLSLSGEEALIGGGWGHGAMPGWGPGAMPGWPEQPWWVAGSKGSKGGYGGGSKAGGYGGSKGSKSGGMDEHCTIEQLDGAVFVGEVPYGEEDEDEGIEYDDDLARITLQFAKPSGTGSGVMEMKYCQWRYWGEGLCNGPVGYNPRWQDMVAVETGFPVNGILPIHVAPGDNFSWACDRRRLEEEVAAEEEKEGAADRVLKEGVQRRLDSTDWNWSISGEYDCSSGELFAGMTFYFKGQGYSAQLKRVENLISSSDFDQELGEGDYCYNGDLPYSMWGAPPAEHPQWGTPPTQGGWGGW